MFIQTEETPNPASLKFIPGQVVMPAGSMEFLSSQDAKSSPLAQKLLAVTGVERVFLGYDFISVTKSNSNDWRELKPQIIGIIADNYLAGMPAVISDDLRGEAGAQKSKTDSQSSANTAPINEGEADHQDEISLQISEIFDKYVRPAVARDGGDIIFQYFSGGVVYVKLMGACSGCPSSSATLKGGIENMLRHYVPEVQEVQVVL